MLNMHMDAKFNLKWSGLPKVRFQPNDSPTPFCLPARALLGNVFHYRKPLNLQGDV